LGKLLVAVCLRQHSSTGVHQNMRGVHHYERVHRDALQTCHTKLILFTKTLC